MSGNVEIIVSREQITPAWLSNALAVAGLKATVSDIKVEPIIAGYYGCSSRLTVSYAEADASLPSSLFLKMATEHEAARANAAEHGMYRYEVGFYTDLASRVNIATPRCFAAEIADDNSAFVLLLEDVAPLVQFDQLEGLNLAQSRLAMQEIAGLHASTWQGKGMETCDWAMMDGPKADVFAQSMIALTPVFLDRFKDVLTRENIDILEKTVTRSEAYWRYQIASKNLAATHCDFRCDNLLFGESDGAPAMATIDWVGMLCSGGRDVAHFLGTSILPELRQAHETELLTHYHDSLLAQGVTDFTLQECIDDYRVNLLYPLFVVVSATASVDIDARGQKLFMSMFDRTCEAIKQSNALYLIAALE